MEIYRNAASTKIEFELPEGVASTTRSVDVVVSEGGRDIYTIETVEVTDASNFSVTLPWHLTRQDREIYVNWTIVYSAPGGLVTVRDRQYVQIVTPILPLEQIAEIAGLDLETKRSDVEDLERQVRYAIQSYTGQNFGKFYGVMSTLANGGNKLTLPAPILEFVGMSFDGIYRPNYGVFVSSNGWSLTSGMVEITSIKQAPPEWMLDRFDYDGKIRAPMIYGNTTFINGVEYKVEGLWGYNDVPGDVQQAARLLVQDYSCDESLWRDRYISSVQSADWRLQFDPQAYSGTGNVQADQILAGYRRLTMAVI